MKLETRRLILHEWRSKDIDDIVEGVLMVIRDPGKGFTGAERHRVYNIGHNKPEDLMNMIAILETTIGRKAEKSMLPLQPGDVPDTCADVSDLMRDVGYAPKTTVDVGVRNFVSWYRDYYKV